MRRNGFLVPVLLLLLVALFGGTVQDASAYRAVFAAGFPEYDQRYRGEWDRFLYNTVRWLCGKPAGTCRLGIADSLGTDAYWYSFMWVNFASKHGDITVTRLGFDPIYYTDYQARGIDVIVISDAWHGPPGGVPPPSPGGKSWVFTDAEIAAIEAYLTANDKGFLVTSGSISQFTKDGPYSNANLMPLLGVESTCFPFDAFPWSRNSGPYPPTRGARRITWTDPGHPIAAGLPNPMNLFYTTAAAQCVGLAGATEVGRYDSSTAGNASLITAYEGGASWEVIDISLHDGVFKGHPTVVFVTAQNISGGSLDVPLLSFAGDASGWISETIHTAFDDDGMGMVVADGLVHLAGTVTLPLGPPDESYNIIAKVTSPDGEASGAIPLSSDSCKNANEMSEYRHYQNAVLFLRTASRNGDPRLGAALAELKKDRDHDFKVAKEMIASTSPGPGNYNLDFIHENLDEGNCQFGVTGAWLIGMGLK